MSGLKSYIEKVVYRDSDSGKFVPKKYVTAHPKTTETERYKLKK